MSWFLRLSHGAASYLVAVGGVLALLLAAFFRGKKAARAEVDASTAAANARMLDAAVRAPQETSDVVKDLRGGRF